MALRRPPPSTDANRKPHSRSHFLNSRNKIRFALPRPRWISMPECPPFKPPTAIQKALYPSGTISSRYVMRTEASKPPAHPTYSSPSVSESRLTSISPSSIPPFRPRAPSMPVSSVAVISASNGPCTTSSDSITAKIAATPIPLSAPSVVPSALTHSPSTRTSMGSFVKSNRLSPFFCGTMSMCACRMIPLRDSMPGVAGLRRITFPASSTVQAMPCVRASATRYARIASSCRDGRGTRAISANFSHTSRGESPSRFVFIKTRFI